MPMTRLSRYLDENQVPYVRIRHAPAFTAQEIAATAHVPGKHFAKTVIVKIDRELHMVVLPATQSIDLHHLKQALAVESIELASEEEFRDRFPGCEVGAMPPFGNLFGLPVLAERSLAEDESIAFNAGSHTELLRMAYADFARLVEPQLVDLAATVL